MVFEEKLKQFELQNMTEELTILNVLGFLQPSSQSHQVKTRDLYATGNYYHFFRKYSTYTEIVCCIILIIFTKVNKIFKGG